MTMIDQDERASRKNALDAFATAAPREDNGQMQVMPMSGGVDRVFGAQKVAVYRDDQRVLQKLAALGAAAGDDWFYRFPVKSKGGGKSFIEGPSIKLANDLARIYGNCEIDVRIMDLGPTWLIYARFTDFESGFAMTRPFQQNKGGSKLGGDDDARRLDIALQIGVSKAIRNVTVNALQTYADYAFSAARNSLVDKIGKDIGKWQDQMAVRLKDRGVDLQRVEYVIGRSLKDWTAPDVAKVIAMMKAIADGMATLDETFPPKDRQTKHDPDTGEVTEGQITAENNGPGDANGEAGKAQAANTATDSAVDQAAKTKSAGDGPKTAQPSETGKPAGDASASGPATSTQHSDASKDNAGSAQVDNGDKKDSKPKADSKADAPKAPTNEREYLAHAQSWIEAITDAAAGEKQWASEKQLRNKANVGPDAREALSERLAEKCREVREADKH